MAKEDFGDPNYFSFKQMMAAILGLALMFVIMKVDYHVYRKPAVVFSALSVAIALLVRGVLPCRNMRTRIGGYNFRLFRFNRRSWPNSR